MRHGINHALATAEGTIGDHDEKEVIAQKLLEEKQKTERSFENRLVFPGQQIVRVGAKPVRTK